MEARMHDDPFGAEPGRQLDIGFEVAVDRLADIGRIFGDVDGGGGVQAEMDLAPLAGAASRRRARRVEAGQSVGRRVELDVDPAHRMLGRPFDRVLQLETAPHIDPDPIAQIHPRLPGNARE